MASLRRSKKARKMERYWRNKMFSGKWLYDKKTTRRWK